MIPPTLASPPAWLQDAACTTHDPELWFPRLEGVPGVRASYQEERQPQVQEAVAICEACPVRTPCLQLALDNDERWGIFGGLTPSQRKRLRVAA